MSSFLPALRPLDGAVPSGSDIDDVPEGPEQDALDTNLLVAAASVKFYLIESTLGLVAVGLARWNESPIDQPPVDQISSEYLVLLVREFGSLLSKLVAAAVCFGWNLTVIILLFYRSFYEANRCRRLLMTFQADLGYPKQGSWFKFIRICFCFKASWASLRNETLLVVKD